MLRTYIKDIPENVGKQVKINGFIQTIRDQGKIVFLIVRDATGTLQAVAFKKIEDLHLESVVEITGIVKEEKQAPGGYEIAIDNLVILSHAKPELPIPVVVEKGGTETDITKRFDYRWIDLRKPGKHKIFKVWTALESGFRKYAIENGFIQLYSPSFMSTPSESGADVFEVDYFDTKAYLAQSPQFYKQLAMAAGFEKVWMSGPVFRAEESFTTRHTTEFTGWDFEISYVDSHLDAVIALEGFLVEAFKSVKKLVPELDIPDVPFPRVTMAEAKEKLQKIGIASKSDYDVSPEEERELCKIIKEETGHEFVFLTDWPIEGRPFYHMRYADNTTITKSYDLLYKGIEIVTGAQREHRIQVLENQAQEKGMSLEKLHGYLDFFRYGCPPHAGAGIGPGRIIMKILDLPSVKEVTFLPRDVKRLTP